LFVPGKVNALPSETSQAAHRVRRTQMPGLQQALALQGLLEQVGEQIADSPQGRSYLSPDGRAFVLAIGGSGAKEMAAFMNAVGQYLVKRQNGRGGKEAAKLELQRAFDEWLSKQQL
jgi:hypothetical protein